ncbi:unnamed protein product [Prorocentrum cordatum]|uniref:ubiquitinyl hydrolase 1 n=1 Tax=Prorocentrum cordatum TaxID=2364126 RepID=A0ABN9UUD6_9DINO|nr:unnamed protein product [Polarella glacialis]
MSSDDLGKMLEEDEAIERAHAEAEKASEAKHDRAANRNLHFIAFVDIRGQVVELDGRNDRPVARGGVAEWGGDFLRAACAMIRAHYMDVSPEALRFHMMAVCTAGGGAGPGGPEAAGPAAQEEALAQLAAFGFGREEAAAALEAAAGDVEAAANSRGAKQKAPA